MNQFASHVILLPSVLPFRSLVPINDMPIEIKDDDCIIRCVKHCEAQFFIDNFAFLRHIVLIHEHTRYRAVPYGYRIKGHSKTPTFVKRLTVYWLSLIHISEPTRLLSISYAVFCLK